MRVPLSGTDLQESTRTDFDALAALFAGVGQQREIHSRANFLQLREAADGAEHLALPATHARAAGIAALYFRQELLLADRGRIFRVAAGDPFRPVQPRPMSGRGRRLEREIDRIGSDPCSLILLRTRVGLAAQPGMQPLCGMAPRPRQEASAARKTSASTARDVGLPLSRTARG